MKQSLYVKLYNNYKQYGFGGFIGKMLYVILRKLTTFSITQHYLMVLDLGTIESTKITAEEKKIVRLDYNDFLKGDKYNFTDDKLKIYKDWLSDGTHIPYGIVRDNVLIYSAWVSLKYMYLLDERQLLAEDEGLLLDDYCHPNYRGKGLHSLVNPFRLKILKNEGKSKVCVIILKGNLPAYKVMVKSKFIVERLYKQIAILKWKWIIVKSINK